MTKFTPAQYKRMPWKNGGGMTTELLAEPKHQGEGFLWRISIAEVAMSGPFSDFSAYQRTIMLLEGDGFILKCVDADGNAMASKRLERAYEPFVFDGAWKTDCSLIDGPIKDFNLMVDRNRIDGELTVRHLKRNETWDLALSPTAILHVIAGEVASQVQHLVPGETLRIDASPGERMRFTATTDAILALAALAPK